MCHCKGVTSRQIDSAIMAGAESVEEIGASCGAGTKCGGCVPLIEMLLESRMSLNAKVEANKGSVPTPQTPAPVHQTAVHETPVQLIAS